MSLAVIRTERVTDVSVTQNKNGSVCGVRYPWLVRINGHLLGEVQVARSQADPHVFGSRAAARDFAARLVTVQILKDVCGTGHYAVPC